METVQGEDFLRWAAGAGIGFDPRYPESRCLTLLPPRNTLGSGSSPRTRRHGRTSLPHCWTAWMSGTAVSSGPAPASGPPRRGRSRTMRRCGMSCCGARESLAGGPARFGSAEMRKTPYSPSCMLSSHSGGVRMTTCTSSPTTGSNCSRQTTMTLSTSNARRKSGCRGWQPTCAKRATNSPRSRRTGLSSAPPGWALANQKLQQTALFRPCRIRPVFGPLLSQVFRPRRRNG